MRSQVYKYISSRFIANIPLQLSIRRVHNLRQANTSTLSTETALQLRDYQESCIDACLNALKRGVTRIGVSMPTGSGKTTVFVSLLHKIPLNETRPAAKNTLIIVNSIELATQAANQVKRMFPETTVEIEQGKNNASGLADV
jgi:ATP-dependent helicase IRC3